MADNKDQTSLEKRLEALEGALGQLQAENENLKKQISSEPTSDKAPEPLEIPKTHFEVDGSKYRFILPRFIYKGQDITAKDALTDKKLLGSLVEMGAGCIKQVK